MKPSTKEPHTQDTSTDDEWRQVVVTAAIGVAWTSGGTGFYFFAKADLLSASVTAGLVVAFMAAIAVNTWWALRDRRRRTVRIPRRLAGLARELRANQPTPEPDGPPDLEPILLESERYLGLNLDSQWKEDSKSTIRQAVTDYVRARWDDGLPQYIAEREAHLWVAGFRRYGMDGETKERVRQALRIALYRLNNPGSLPSE